MSDMTHEEAIAEYRKMYGQSVPYGRASVVDGRAATTCLECGEVFVSDGVQRNNDGRKYAKHYEEMHRP